MRFTYVYLFFVTGLDHIYVRGDLYDYGTTMKISPETVDGAGKACFQINGTSTEPTDTPQTVIPDLTGFKVL